MGICPPIRLFFFIESGGESINGRSNFSKDFDKNYRFTKRTIFETQFCKNYYFFMNKQFFPTNSKNSFFTERTILINKLFYWTNKVDGKWTIYLRTNEIIFFEWLRKRKKWVVHERWTNEMKKRWRSVVRVLRPLFLKKMPVTL